MAERVGIDRSFLADVERGKRNISILNIALIAEGLDVSLSRLLSRLGPGPTRHQGQRKHSIRPSRLD